jgi:hypothetical protein
MQDFKNLQIKPPIESDIKWLEAFAVIAALALVVGAMVTICVDAIVKTVETEEEQRIFRPDTKRPKAYRMSSPTPEQMDKYHELMVIQEVRR